MPHFIQSKTILNKTKKRDEWFLDDYTLNPYSGCSFNCLYCYIRGSKYGINMEERLSVKENAVELLNKQLLLRSKKKQHGFVVMSSATEPYLQFEKSYGLTRKLLQILLKYQFPVHVITKSDLVQRDFDILNEIDQTAILPDDLQLRPGRGTLVTFSFSTIEERVRSIFEPGATPIKQRLNALEKAAHAGFKTGVSLMPLLPHISDAPELLEMMYKTFKDAGAQYIMPSSTTLFGFNQSDSKVLVIRALMKHYPELVDEYNNLFAYGQRVPYDYQNELKSITDQLNKEYKIPNRII